MKYCNIDCYLHIIAMGNLRLNRHRTIALGARRRIVGGRHLRVDVAVQLVVQIKVALVFQRGAARGALEAVHVQVLVLDAHEHTAEHVDERGECVCVCVRAFD